MLNVQQVKFYVDALCVIGASHGEDTNLILFDMDLSTALAHAYPVAKNEIAVDEWVIGIDDLQEYYQSWSK